MHILRFLRERQEHRIGKGIRTEYNNRVPDEPIFVLKK